MLLAASATASPLLPVRFRSSRGGGSGGGRRTPPRTFGVRLDRWRGGQFRSSTSSFSCACSPLHSPGDGGKEGARDLFDDFSVLSPVILWEEDDIWRIYAGYFFILHIPLSFGGLDMVAKVLHCSSLNPMTTVISTVILQLTEFSLALALLQYTAMPGRDVQAYFVGKVSTQQNWIKEAATGFGLLMILVLTTSVLIDKLIGPEDDPSSCPFFMPEAKYRAILSRRMANEGDPGRTDTSLEFQWLKEDMNELK